MAGQEVMALRIDDMEFEFNHSMLDDLVNERLDGDRDVKIIVTARNSETGTGKTTLAIVLAVRWDRNGWNPSKGFQDIRGYLAYYSMVGSPGDVLILDDAQAGADSRRSTSKENVAISKYWSILRSKNIVSILTLPTQSMLDKRLLELADVWLNVRNKGEAVPYRVYVDDIKKYVRTYRFQHPDTGLKEVIRWDKLTGKQYKKMEKLKAQFTENQYKEDFDENYKDVLDR